MNSFFSTRAALASLALFSTLVVSCGPALAQSPQAQSVPTLPACTGLRWIVNAGSLKHSQPDFPLDLQTKYFNSTCTFLVVGANPPAEYKDWHAVRTRTITTIAALDDVVNDPDVRAVLYDPEGWQMTPPEEQRDPAAAACRAAPIVHAHNKLLIVTPATNLVRFLAPGSIADGQRFATFAKTAVAGRIAPCADVYEIQAQGAESDAGEFQQFVRSVAHQARTANPHVVILAGISTNPMGRRVSARDVFKAVQSVRTDVDGFWLNIPAAGKFCPTCGEPQPKVAVDLLQMLSPQ